MNPSNYPHLFIVEDDRSLCSLVSNYFNDEEFNVTCFHHGNGASDAIINEQPDIVLLDLELPGTDGIEICRKIRKNYSKPVIMLTGNDSDFIEVSALNIGADKFLRKPVKLPVLLAHTNALLRRRRELAGAVNDQAELSSESLDSGVILDQGSMSAIVDGQQVDLNGCELGLLSMLISRAGKCVSREELHEYIRGFDYDGFDRTVDLKVSDLRKKLNDVQTPYQRLKTVRGKGYLFCKSEVSGEHSSI